jgi:hypothetical protein
MAFSSVQAEQPTTSVELKPKQVQTLSITLKKDQVARVHVHVDNGLMGIRANLLGTKERPILKIDMGRGTQITYIVGGSAEGQYNLELSSLEQKKLVRASIAIDQPAPAEQASIDLRDAEDALANADLVRNHAKNAPPGLDPIESYDQAPTLATKLNETPHSLVPAKAISPKITFVFRVIHHLQLFFCVFGPKIACQAPKRSNSFEQKDIELAFKLA